MSSDRAGPTEPKETVVDEGLVDKLRRVLWGSGKTHEVRPVAAPRKTLTWKQAGGGDADEAEFLGQIRQLLERTPSLQASRVNIIGLKRIKERFGDAWQRVADRADRIARNVIERHLDPGDIYATWGEDTYITVFARLSEQEARVKCYLIGNEIVRTLLGDDASEYLEVKTAVTRVDGSVDLKAVGSMDQMFEGAEVISPLAPPELKAGADDAPRTNDDTGLTLVPIERDRVVQREADAVRANVLAGVDFVFRPMWDPTRNVIATYLCVPRVRLSDIDGAVGDASLAVAGDSDAMARLDAATVARVKGDLRAMAADGRRLIIAMPIHFETLCSTALRRRCAAEIGTIPEAMKQYLVIEVIDVPAGVLKSRLMEVIAPLRLHCRAVSLQVAIGTIDFTQIRGTGISAVGAEIAHLAKSEFILMQQLARFQRAAEKAEVVTFLHGAQTRSLVAAAVGAGFHYVDGDAVAATLARPDRIVPFQLADLYMPR
ncbi:MAG TPA: hypothetical protein VN823_05275 [Stellaceae bacterium]|nr:hypothetical protein [Stellaceae bacterium]